MKKLVVLIALFSILTSPLIAQFNKQDSVFNGEQLKFSRNVLTYAEQKKDVGTAFVMALILPGGGHFYASSEFAPIVLAIEIGLTYYLIKQRPREVYMISFVKLFSAVSAMKEPEKYNYELRKQLKIDYIQR
jgi:hypothetical protein